MSFILHPSISSSTLITNSISRLTRPSWLARSSTNPKRLNLARVANFFTDPTTIIPSTYPLEVSRSSSKRLNPNLSCTSLDSNLPSLLPSPPSVFHQTSPLALKALTSKSIITFTLASDHLTLDLGETKHSNLSVKPTPLLDLHSAFNSLPSYSYSLVIIFGYVTIVAVRIVITRIQSKGWWKPFKYVIYPSLFFSSHFFAFFSWGLVLSH